MAKRSGKREKGEGPTVTRWVCDHCHSFWFNPSPSDHCPSCGGSGREREVKDIGGGVLATADDD